jgi:hypothetical protein
MKATTTTTYERIMQLLSDGGWHREEELGRVSAYPREWVKELTHVEDAIVERDPRDGYVVRLVAA